MRKTAEERDAAYLAKAMVVACIRNTYLEDLHAGKYFPITKTGDFSDVKVIDGEGREFAWSEMSRFSDDEMKKLIKEFVNRIYTFLLMDMESDKTKQKMSHWTKFSTGWDDAEIDDFVVQVLKEVKIG